MELAAAIRIGDTGGMVFIQRQVLRVTIDSGAGTENHGAYIAGVHGLQQADGALHVVGVVVDRLLDGLANSLEASKMHDGIDSMVAHGADHGVSVANVCLYKGHTIAQDALQTIQYGHLAVGEVVQQNDLMVGFYQRNGGMATNVAGSSSEQDFHRVFLLVRLMDCQECAVSLTTIRRVLRAIR